VKVGRREGTSPRFLLGGEAAGRREWNVGREGGKRTGGSGKQ